MTGAMYADKLMLWNSGQLPPHWTVAKLKQKHSSQPFNPDIANAFFRAGRIEAWGRGIELMLGACRQAGVPEPALTYETSGLWVTFSFPKLDEKLDERLDENAPGEKTREKTREKLLRLLPENPQASTAEVAQALGITNKGVEWQVNRLKKEGVLKRVGPDRGGHWEVIE